MHFDDFIADQVMPTSRPHPRPVDVRRPGTSLLGSLWTGVRRIASGIDAFAAVRHGVTVPPDHGARTCPRSPDS